MKQICFFDLWGTLAYIPQLDQIQANALAALGSDRFAQLHDAFIEWHTEPISTDTFIQNMRSVLAISTAELAAVQEYIAPSEYVLYPETHAALTQLRNSDMRVGIITNSPPSSKSVVYALGLDQFIDVAVFSCDVGIMKPQKEIFSFALSEARIKASQAIMVGDSLEKDIEGARAAGIDAVLIDRLHVGNSKSIHTLSEVGAHI